MLLLHDFSGKSCLLKALLSSLLLLYSIFRTAVHAVFFRLWENFLIIGLVELICLGFRLEAPCLFVEVPGLLEFPLGDHSRRTAECRESIRGFGREEAPESSCRLRLKASSYQYIASRYRSSSISSAPISQQISARGSPYSKDWNSAWRAFFLSPRAW